MKVKLLPMGMPLQNGDAPQSDMGNYRLRVTRNGEMDGYILNKDGDRIACEFSIMLKNNTNNQEGDILLWEMELHSKGIYKRYIHNGDNSRGMIRRLPPTLESIETILEELTGKKIEVEVMS